jgi:hypothetical protein
MAVTLFEACGGAAEAGHEGDQFRFFSQAGDDLPPAGSVRMIDANKGNPERGRHQAFQDGRVSVVAAAAPSKLKIADGDARCKRRDNAPGMDGRMLRVELATSPFTRCRDRIAAGYFRRSIQM